MYISKIKISNFRNFSNEVIEFTEGLNVIVGHNNSGKTNLLKALQFVFDRNLRVKPSIDDFNKDYKDFSKPPKIEITVSIKESENQKEMADDKNVIYEWLIRESPKYEAQLTFSFFLPNKHWKEYEQSVEELKESGQYIPDECFKLIEKKFLKKYVTRFYGGDPKKEEKAETENLDRFDFQFLDAIRDAERQMFYGNNTLLRDVLNYFLDYNITEGKDFEGLDNEQKLQLKENEDIFKGKSRDLLSHLIKRISKDEILSYSNEIGAEKGGKPDFDAEISEQELLFALRLIVSKNGFEIPIKNNGLGYNNLLFIALVLAKMQMERSGFMGDNAKVFPILAIEEPEAHLHPSLQYKFLQFLDNNLNKQKQARQIFITTHSTHITSAIDLDSIICLYEDFEGNHRVGYVGKAFGEKTKSKNYVRRFLDATKSNMLFADRIIFVEGLAEQILLPCLAAYEKVDDDTTKEDLLINKHVCIVSVDSRTFNHFLILFGFNSDTNKYAIRKKVVCITDADPTIKKGNRWHSTYPFILDNSDNSKSLASHITELKERFQTPFQNIKICHPEEGKGKTLEYELARYNPTSNLLITDSFPSQNSPHSRENYIELLRKHENVSIDKLISEYSSKLGDNAESDEIINGIRDCDWAEDDKKNAFIAAIYHRIVSKTKGEHSLFLEQNLRENLAREIPEKFVIPDYLKNAIDFVLE